MLAFRNKEAARSVAVEIVGFCNASCTFCPAGSNNIASKTKFMDTAYFEEIIKHFFDEKILLSGKTIGLFHTSEAFLHPNIDSIFDILEKYKLKAQVSSNFIRYPKLQKRHYKNLSTVTFSLCSFQEDRYKKVYGADIQKVLDNFNTFLKEVRSVNADIDIQVNWIRYRYNQDEENTAKHYFRSVLGVKLNIVSAILLDMQQYEDILINCEIDKFECFNKDIFLEEQLEHMKYVKSLNAPFVICEEFFNIVVDVNGSWIRCCRTSNRDPKNVIGTFKDINTDSLSIRTTDDSNMCKFCSSYYIPDSAYLVESATNIKSLIGKLDIRQEHHYVIYGSGHLAQVIFRVIENAKAFVSYFIDDTKSGEVFGVSVISFEEFEKIYSNTDATIVISATNNVTISKIKSKIDNSGLLKTTKVISL